MPSDPEIERIAKAICAERGLTFLRDVGSGAFKHSFHVRTATGENRAFKLYKEAGSGARIEREVRAIARCNHPGVVRFELLDTKKVERTTYIYSLEEFLAGGTLSSRIATSTISTPELQLLGTALIDAVAHIAGLRLVHRDLKPDNIMFRTPGHPVIVDFGLVRDLDATSLTKTWAMQGPGTPYYSAPEQLLNEKAMIDWRADQFALGVVLAICGTGNHPYSTPDMEPSQVVEQVAQRSGPSASFVEWANSVKLAPLVRMVASWPVHRYRTPTQLATDWAKLSGE